MIRTYENARQEKLIELGFICYNRYFNGTFRVAHFTNIFYEVRIIMDKLRVARYQMDSMFLAQSYEYQLREKILEFGCICYNLYIDDIVYDSAINGLCEYIRQINSNIIRISSPQSYFAPVSRAVQGGYLVDATDEVIDISDNTVIQSPSGNGISELKLESNDTGYGTFSSSEISHTSSYKEFGASAHGMEPVPPDYIRCRCGYRNRSYASFCARCGRQL